MPTGMVWGGCGSPQRALLELPKPGGPLLEFCRLVSASSDSSPIPTLSLTRQVGEWFRDNTRGEAVTLTADTHIAASGFYGGRPSLVAYAGVCVPRL
jgi:hypothetical protein